MHFLHKRNILDYSYIVDGIYMGTNQCCMSGLSEMLKKEGITDVISLEDIRVDSPFGVQTYSWIPVKDGHTLTGEQFDFGVSLLEKLIMQKKKVYVHCKSGHGRTGSLVSAYLIKDKGYAPKEAMEFIKSKRPAVHFSDAQIFGLDDFWSNLKK